MFAADAILFRSRRPSHRGRSLVWIVVVGVVIWIAWQALTSPDVATLARQNPRTTAFVERYRQRHGEADLLWIWVPYARISPHLKRAVLVGEDINFFAHGGFDTQEIRHALQDAWEDRALPRGASTISQQVAKNLWLSPSWNPLRKLREALLTRQLEKNLGKRRILELYLNVAEFGPGTYGAEAAARRYFGKSAADLGPEEAAQLAAGLPKPTLWHPGSHSHTYQRRVDTLLHRMDKATFLLHLI